MPPLRTYNVEDGLPSLDATNEGGTVVWLKQGAAGDGSRGYKQRTGD